jgi:hypothetical protein
MQDLSKRNPTAETTTALRYIVLLEIESIFSCLFRHLHSEPEMSSIIIVNNCNLRKLIYLISLLRGF